MLALQPAVCQAAESLSCLSAVVEWAGARLCESGYPALRRVSCASEGDTLTVRGCLPTYYLKQVTLAVVAGIEGVEQVVDRIEVRSPVAWELHQG